MQFTTAIVALLASAVVAVPTGDHGSNSGGTAPYSACSGLQSSLQCCATDILGLANLDCGPPPAVPTSAENFRDICAAITQRARCCVLPVLGQGLVCQVPTGVRD
ncbi:fungal hydrophobin [Colletotrichum orchidophilum]|uniref:Fungal hydrophobin n=1 Tax=Colletotrichum orchidophilum TaxID=1209926 RepID=A0A1G4BK94_9PEZI|nr:fungal hydrophobin [Colletotrichum orchidophilum]OHF01900.1 fungal hydrophobin [Colletotrichum orchidophilum]